MNFKETFKRHPYFKILFITSSFILSLLSIMIILFELKGDFKISIPWLYGIATLVSFILFLAYCLLIKIRKIWLTLLYFAVSLVNFGYFSLSLSSTISEALLANRIAYLGSVLLPLSMLMLIVELCHLKYQKIYIFIAGCISALMFILAGSPGYSTLYYQEVSLLFLDHYTKLVKVYGPLHFLYLIYLFTYFGLMILIIVRSHFKEKAISTKQMSLIALASWGNVLVWLLEKVVDLQFEFLSITYIMSELFFLLLFFVSDQEEKKSSEILIVLDEENILEMMEQLQEYPSLTKREKEVLKYLLLNKKRKDIAELLNVTEHTVKKHTSHIFDKLAVNSRNELFEKIKAEVVL